MISAILTDIKQLSITETPIPEVSNGQKLLKVLYCALCKTDAKMFFHGHRDLCCPRVLGHEAVLQDQKTGLKYLLYPGVCCGICENCTSGYENLCDTIKIAGFNFDGALRQYVSVPVNCLIKLPETINPAIATLAEPLACCINALEQLQLLKGSQVLIFGAGPVGLLMALAVKESSGEAFIVETNPQKLERAKLFLKELNINTNVLALALQFDAAINACASPETFQEGLKHLKKRGKYCVFSGLTGDSSTISTDSINKIHYKQLTITGAYGCTRNNMLNTLAILEKHQTILETLIEQFICINDIEEHLNSIWSGEAYKYIVKMV